MIRFAHPLSALLLTGTLVLATQGATADTSPSTLARTPIQAPGYYRMMLGQFEVTAISDGTITLPVDKLLRHVDAKTLRNDLTKAHLSTQVETSINAFVINTGEHVILVDTGSGHLFGDQGGQLLKSLAAAGYPADKIDTILLTHLHADHSGGLADQGRLAFPNAQVYVHQADVDFWLNPAAHRKDVDATVSHGFEEARDALQPVMEAKRLHTFDRTTELLPGIRALPTPGHTPGHTRYEVTSDGQTLVLWGDIIHVAAAQLNAPARTIRFDVHEHEAAASRKALLRDAAQHHYLIGAAHIAFPGLGYVDSLDGGDHYHWQPINYSLKGLTPYAR